MRLFPLAAIITVVQAEFKCRGRQKQYEECEIEPCEEKVCIDCTWSEWSPWGACPCHGLKERHRVIAQQSNSCGQPCEGAKVETISCHPECVQEDQDCELSEWGMWSDCDKPCEGGQKVRSRTVVQEKVANGKACDGSLTEVASCNVDVKCSSPIDCKLSEWGSWSKCSTECGGGEQYRSREVEVIGQNGGKPCEGTMREMRACNQKPCGSDVDCVWHDWQPWSACSVSCGVGTKARSRMIEKAPRGNGKLCDPVDMVEVSKCFGGACGVQKDCVFSEWSQWDACSCECHGIQQRTRHIDQYPTEGGDNCVGALKELRGCNGDPEKDCHIGTKTPVDCVWSPWGDWEQCSKECGGGQRRRTRSILTPPQYSGAPCEGSAQEIQGCNNEICQSDIPSKGEPVDCAWTEWDNWGACSVSCGGGQKFRQRQVSTLSNKWGEACNRESAMEVAECNTAACESQNCVWSEWSNWSVPTCTGLCERHRSIAQHYAGDGTPCEGAKVETKRCPVECAKKPVDCQLSEWSNWGTCTEPCGGGQTRRSRKVLVHSENGGLPCEGALNELKGCNQDTECETSMDCKLAEWGSWSECTATCGGGEQHRARKVANLAKFGGKPCNDEMSEVRGCNEQCCGTPVDCVWSDWSDWGDCSKSCGGGQKVRNRNVATAPRDGGKLCDAKVTMEVAVCNAQACAEECRDGAWSAWTDWSICSATCGEGYRSRHRQVSQTPNSCGKSVEGPFEQFDKCVQADCGPEVRDCTFSDWSDWGDCSCKCNGVRERTRRINQYAQGAGSKPCTGSTKEVEPCNKPGYGTCKEDLPIDCQIGEWSDWSKCTALCDGGTTERSRDIIQYPKNGGKACEGHLSESRGCNHEACAGVEDCEWGPWVEWGSCSKECEGGERTRFRHIIKMAKKGGSPCVAADAGEVQACNTDSCGTEEYCVWGQWGDWDQCSEICGPGTRYRSRYLEKSNSPLDQADALSVGVLDDVLGFGHYNLGGSFNSDHIFGTFLFGMASSGLLLSVISSREYFSNGNAHRRIENMEEDVEMNQME